MRTQKTRKISHYYEFALKINLILWLRRYLIYTFMSKNMKNIVKGMEEVRFNSRFLNVLSLIASWVHIALLDRIEQYTLYKCIGLGKNKKCYLKRKSKNHFSEMCVHCSITVTCRVSLVSIQLLIYCQSQ